MNRVRFLVGLGFLLAVFVGIQARVFADQDYLEIYANDYGCSWSASHTLIIEAPPHLDSFHVWECDDPGEDFCWSVGWLSMDGAWTCAVECEEHGASNYDWHMSACEGWCTCEYE